MEAPTTRCLDDKQNTPPAPLKGSRAAIQELCGVANCHQLSACDKPTVNAQAPARRDPRKGTQAEAVLIPHFC